MSHSDTPGELDSVCSLQPAQRAERGGLLRRAEQAQRTISSDVLAQLSRPMSPRAPTSAGDRRPTTIVSAAVSATLKYMLGRLTGEASYLSAPMQGRVREAAYRGESLHEVLQLALLVHCALETWFIRTAEAPAVQPTVLSQLLISTSDVLVDVGRLITEEFDRALADKADNVDRKAQAVERLLEGRPTAGYDLAYPLRGWHLAGIATEDQGPLVRSVAARFGMSVLSVTADPEAWWFWLGTTRQVDGQSLMRDIVEGKTRRCSVGLGEIEVGEVGWRRSHGQAAAALSVAWERPDRIAKYGEAALLASMKQDQLLRESLEIMYLRPLTEDQGGPDLRATLRAYFAADRNKASAAAALGVTRQAVSYRLDLAEARIGRSLRSCAHSIEAALMLEDVEASAPT